VIAAPVPIARGWAGLHLSGGFTVSDLNTLFTEAAAASKTLPERPDNDTLLQIYALYKQATEGNVQSSRPGFMDPVGRAKWDAWEEVKGMSQDAAKQAYVDLINRLKAQE
jgi:acyl-CoA-binding protein